MKMAEPGPWNVAQVYITHHELSHIMPTPTKLSKYTWTTIMRAATITLKKKGGVSFTGARKVYADGSDARGENRHDQRRLGFTECTIGFQLAEFPSVDPSKPTRPTDPII